MAISDAHFLKGWKEVLTACRLKPGEQVTVLTGDDSNRQIAYIAKLAASDLGAVVTELNLPVMNGEKALSPDKSGYVGKTALELNSAALACLKASDLVIDTLQLLFSKEQEEVLKGGTRMLLAVEPPEIMMRQIPRPEDKLRVLAAAKKIGAAKEMHVTSAAGTDFRARRELVPGSMSVHVIGDYGAMQMGTHRFYALREGKADRLTETGKFIDLWKREGDGWKLARVISYDHVLAD